MRYCLCTKSTQTTIHDVGETKKARQGRSTPPAVTRKQGRAKANDYFACSTTLGYDPLPLCISIHPTPQRDSTTSPHSHSANPLHRPATPLPRLLSRILLHTNSSTETRTEYNEKKWAEITNARCARRRSRVPSMSLDICVLVSPLSFLYSFLVGPCKSFAPLIMDTYNGVYTSIHHTFCAYQAEPHLPLCRRMRWKAPQSCFQVYLAPFLLPSSAIYSPPPTHPSLPSH
jgi:hypothetical protein